jgi:hypothetical protein
MGRPINIKPGREIIRYAQINGMDVDDVVAWGMAQVHGPFTPAQAYLIPMTPDERLETWKAAVKRDNEESITGRIKADLAMKEAA